MLHTHAPSSRRLTGPSEPEGSNPGACATGIRTPAPLDDAGAARDGVGAATSLFSVVSRQPGVPYGKQFAVLVQYVPCPGRWGCA